MARVCRHCGRSFGVTAWIDGKKKNLQRRKFCLACSPFGVHNTRPIGHVKRHGEVVVCRECSKPLRRTQLKGRVCWDCKYRERSKRYLDRAYAIVGEACWRCGYGRGSKGRRLLDFHHVHREEKAFSLDCRHVVNLAWNRVLAEMKKCVLLCANCHRECEAGLISAAEISALQHANARRFAGVEA
jgi:hypothetical protein